MSARRRKPAAGPRAGCAGRGDLVTSLAFVFPLFLAYQLGTLLSQSVNGVDFVSSWVFELVGGDVTRYALVHGAMALAFLLWLMAMRRRRPIRMDEFSPMLLESCIYALTLGSLIIFVMSSVIGIDPAAIGSSTLVAGVEIGALGDALVTSLGAGVHEELMFRLGLMAGGAACLRALGVRLSWAVVIAALASSAIFSAAHHIGPNGDPLQGAVFLYRMLAGLVFAAIFYFRSFAHAVYTHFLYDFYVLVIRS